MVTPSLTVLRSEITRCSARRSLYSSLANKHVDPRKRARMHARGRKTHTLKAATESLGLRAADYIHAWALNSKPPPLKGSQ